MKLIFEKSSPERGGVRIPEDRISPEEKTWLYFFPALFFLLKGPGTWSLDFLISRKG
jgi:hypothetical protein